MANAKTQPHMTNYSPIPPPPPLSSTGQTSREWAGLGKRREEEEVKKGEQRRVHWEEGGLNRK